ncbi:universal stress protein [Mucilaginibacter xinganensis]|uniref:Nucleotide-binding universal stress protein, UspA family n=1 Tax=Mucilaginibacter xinganensis TaxID=1234841 RepID=A0A223NRF8_9SPHI|nr:universal stress protein [Mucilaginibacter xinganensis]ASU32386.1 Nucleotide-binding universal stress protein, UspA family [Mucilaginibacter xinganensis]
MEKILVTTDQSSNSKSAIRYAAKLAKLRHAELVILQVYHLLKPFKWSDAAFEKYADEFKQKTTAELNAFVKDVCRTADQPAVRYQIALHDNFDTVDGIIEYSAAHNCKYICISTRGAGAFKKIFGTNTSKLINRSETPVLCIPSAYRTKPIKHVLYASDMTDYERELLQVVEFARPVKATVELLHVFYPYEFLGDKALTEASLKKKANYGISVHNLKRDVTNALLDDIGAAVKASKPSLLVLFTHQARPLFERLLFPGNAEEYSFYGNIPLLTFNKSPVIN